jgi:hypothetical protein
LTTRDCAIFLLSGPGSLFLAGDTAQSVVEGVEFRFEDICSVAHHLFGKEHPHLIPEKPKHVTLNFRSHSGVLNVAAGVLGHLLRVFPDSAKQLKEDFCIFKGPRPSIFENVPTQRLQELAKRIDGLVFLTHDNQVVEWKRMLGNYPLVYGICEAKGFEFQSFVIVDFFKAQSCLLQDAWRSVWLDRDTHMLKDNFPEIEGQLKLLYIAVTRCISTLFFAETSSSVASHAFVHWISEKPKATGAPGLGGDAALAIKQSVQKVEKMIRSPDEWRIMGMDNAVVAETCDDDPKAAGTSLDHALYCFEQWAMMNCVVWFECIVLVCCCDPSLRASEIATIETKKRSACQLN